MMSGNPISRKGESMRKPTEGRTRWAWVLLLPLLLGGCTDPVTPLAVIILTNTWQEEGNPDHTIFFDDDTGGVAQSSGTFIGTETMPDGTEFDVAGGWDNSRVTMTTDRVPGVTWRARIREDNANRLEFSSDHGYLTLVR